MVLVKHEIPVRASVPQSQGSSNAGLSTETSARDPLLQETNGSGSTFQVEPRPNIEPSFPRGLETPADRQQYQMQLMLLEQQTSKQLMMARQGPAERLQGDWNSQRAKGSEELNAASREDYHLQQMALEHENGKRLMGARRQLATHTDDSRNQGHDAQASVASYEQMDPMTKMSQLRLLEEQNKRRSEEIRGAGAQRQRHGCAFSEASIRDDRSTEALNDYQMQLMQLEMQNKKNLKIYRQEEDAAKQTEASSFASQSPPAQAEDKWGKGPFPAGQGVISGYEVQLMALENRRKEEAAARSQTEIEFSQQRRRYLAGEAEMSRLSGQQLPGAPGSSCAPLSTVYGHPPAFRPVPRPDAEYDDLYDN
ncbi:hypothetical protein BKA61DRAFT_683717 [Leptodontidium sp. MPI-SDFR-AT-0119]|nr:hypothetical protein BKA61DRAFT_683717 [Leptodontidium sp. MPI-SDFR-AT-0119]